MATLAQNMADLESKLGEERARQAAVSAIIISTFLIIDNKKILI